MRAISGWLAGRKTYLLAGVIFLAVVALVFLGRLTPAAASAIALFGVSGFAVTFRSALARHQAEELAILEDIALAGKAAAAHNNAALVSGLVKTAEDGSALATRIQEEQGA